MSLNRTIRVFANACVLAVAISFALQASSKTTDYSDVWSTASEDGWSVLFVQQDFTIFAAMYVYGPDGKATWHAAALHYQGRNTFVWSGDLFTATGPWFASTPFAPSAVTVADSLGVDDRRPPDGAPDAGARDPRDPAILGQDRPADPGRRAPRLPESQAQDGIGPGERTGASGLRVHQPAECARRSLRGPSGRRRATAERCPRSSPR